MGEDLLRRVRPLEIPVRRARVVDPAVTRRAEAIVQDVCRRGEEALREYVNQYDGALPGAPLLYSREELADAADRIDREVRELLERISVRIRGFARAQRACISDLDVGIEGGRAGHIVVPVESAGCYAPGGRYPLPSSVLMTVGAAREAGVKTVWVATPRPAPVMLAAAAVAGADGLLAAGGAQAVAALAYGAGTVPACAVVVGPGNKWVTAAKALIYGDAGIDLFAGPSELVVLADSSADAGIVAASLLAAAEHDRDAVPMLVSLDAALPVAVNRELERRLATLSTAATAREALHNGFAVAVQDASEAVAVCDRIAPEHVELRIRDAKSMARQLRNYGCVFIGEDSCEVLGDYGAGPNHTLPTGGCARFASGLSVMHFLRWATWVQMDESCGSGMLPSDAARMARLEGLEAHARCLDQGR